MILSTVLTDLIIVVVVSAFACFTFIFLVIDYNNTEKISLYIIEDEAVANHNKNNISNDNKKTSIVGTPYQYEKTKKNVRENP